MVETHWGELEGREIRYREHTWELTGDVDVRETGNSLAVDARQVDDVRGKTATLYFDLATKGESLNPGDLGGHFDRVEREDGNYRIVVKKEARTYRYELHRMKYD